MTKIEGAVGEGVGKAELGGEVGFTVEQTGHVGQADGLVDGILVRSGPALVGFVGALVGTRAEVVGTGVGDGVRGFKSTWCVPVAPSQTRSTKPSPLKSNQETLFPAGQNPVRGTGLEDGLNFNCS